MHPILVGQRRLDEIARPAVEEKPDAVVDADQPIAVGPRRTAAFEQNALIGIGGKDADAAAAVDRIIGANPRSEEHTSELQSLMRISYAVFCLKKKNNQILDTSRYHSPSVAMSIHTFTTRNY